jgi:hypothetical protein
LGILQKIFWLSAGQTFRIFGLDLAAGTDTSLLVQRGFGHPG